MKSRDLVTSIFVICLCLTVFAAREKKKRRGCKCMQRFLKDVDKMIEKRLKKFEQKYFLPAVSEKGNRTKSISKEDRRWIKLNGDVHYTKEALQKMSKNLNFVKEQVNSQKHDTEVLNEHFTQLSMYVTNLTSVVDRLEVLMSRQSVEVTTHASAPPRQPTLDPSYPRHCQEVYEHGGLKFEGDYHIMIKPEAAPEPFKVVCRSFNNSGWTVIQRRQDGSVDFYRNWDAYKEGFGDRHTEFWLGNDKIHYLTSQGDMMLRIDMQDWDNKNYMATYDHFSVDDESKLYRLHVSGYHGNSGDSLTSHWESHDGMAFSTKDKDNDGRYYDSCAHHYHGAWWFNNCFDSHLNGKYYTKGFHRNYFQRDGIQWNSIHQYSSLKHVEIMIKPADRPKPTPRISNDV